MALLLMSGFQPSGREARQVRSFFPVGGLHLTAELAVVRPGVKELDALAGDGEHGVRMPRQ
jgi:hypothetical protein